MNASCTRLVTGASDNQLRVWALDTEQEGGEGDSGGVGAMEVDGESEGGERGQGEDAVVAVYMGSVVRQGNGET